MKNPPEYNIKVGNILLQNGLRNLSPGVLISRKEDEVRVGGQYLLVNDLQDPRIALSSGMSRRGLLRRSEVNEAETDLLISSLELDGLGLQRGACNSAEIGKNFLDVTFLGVGLNRLDEQTGLLGPLAVLLVLGVVDVQFLPRVLRELEVIKSLLSADRLSEGLIVHKREELQL